MDNMEKMKICEMVCNSSQEIFLAVNDGGTVLYANKIAYSLLGYEENELDGIQIEKLFLDKNISISDELNSCKAKDVIKTISIYRKNTTCFPVLLKLAYDKDENIYILSAIDNSELLQAQKQAEFVNEKINEALKVKDEFTANVTHELRTPVNGIKGHTQYLMMTELTKDQSKELNIINECCLNMEKLINNILDFSKLQAGKFSLSEKEFVFRDCIKYIVETNGKLIENKGLRFIVNIDDAIPEKLYGDDFRLIQILNNFLSNALKFTAKGYIAIEVTKSMQVGRDIELFFMVMDTGIGIPPEKKDSLFQSFTQVDASISRTYGGTGLGLAITKQLVDLMNGKVRLESEPGKGSSFTFTVRMQIPEGVEIETSDEQAVPLKIDHAKRVRILMEEADKINAFGSEENKAEILKLKERLSICIDMENFEKAEQFADSLKSLVSEGPQELKQLCFRMQMMIRKEDIDNSRKFFDQFSDKITEIFQ